MSQTTGLGTDIRNINAWLTANYAETYDVVLYQNSDRSNRIASFWIEQCSGATNALTIGPNLTPPIFIQSWAAGGYGANPTYQQADSKSQWTNAFGFASIGNFIVFSNLNADSIIIRGEDNYSPTISYQRDTPNGLQLIPRSKSAPSFPYTHPSKTPALTNNSAGVGSIVKFLYPAAGGGVTYQWMAGPIGSGSYTNLSNDAMSVGGWTNGGAGSKLAGCTSSLLILSNINVDNSADYVLFAQNSVGNITSDPITLRVQPSVFTVPARDQTLYPTNANAHFSVTVTSMGTAPWYRWMKDGTILAEGASGTGSAYSGTTNTFLTVSNVSSADAGTYSIIVSNWVNGAEGWATNSAALTVLDPPAAGSFAEAVMTNRAYAYWRVGETGTGSSLTNFAYDYMGGFNGVYGLSANPGANGPDNGTFPGFEADRKSLALGPGRSNNWITVPPLWLSSSNFTIVAWVKLVPVYDRTNNPVQMPNAGILTTRHGLTQNGLQLTGGRTTFLRVFHQPRWLQNKYFHFPGPDQ